MSITIALLARSENSGAFKLHAISLHAWSVKWCRCEAPRGGMCPTPIVMVPFDRITIDIVGPQTLSASHLKYILLVVDHTTWYPVPHSDGAAPLR